MSAPFLAAVQASTTPSNLELQNTDRGLSTLQIRRTHYGLSKESTVPDARLRSIIETAIIHVPSPFNSQSGRVVLLLGKESDKLWEIVKTGFLKTLGNNGQYTASCSPLRAYVLIRRSLQRAKRFSSAKSWQDTHADTERSCSSKTWTL
jgi:hypothetical protein